MTAVYMYVQAAVQLLEATAVLTGPDSTPRARAAATLVATCTAVFLLQRRNKLNNSSSSDSSSNNSSNHSTSSSSKEQQSVELRIAAELLPQLCTLLKRADTLSSVGREALLLAVKCCLIVSPPTAATAAAVAPALAQVAPTVAAVAAVHIDDEYGSFDFNDADLLMMDALEVKRITMTCITRFVAVLMVECRCSDTDSHASTHMYCSHRHCST
jgi:hypothetical protein